MAGAAPLTNTFDTYDAIGVREDLSDLIADISPTDTPLLSNIGSASCSSRVYDWQTDTLAAAAQNHQIEGFDVTTHTAVVPTVRLQNYTSILQKDWMISETEEAVTKAGRASERGYQTAKAAKEMKRDQETNLTANNAAVAGDSSTARETAGLLAWIKTNTSLSATNGADPAWGTIATGARSDGVARAASEDDFKEVIRECYDSGGDPSMVMVGTFNKQAFSSFAGIAAQRHMASGQGPSTIVGSADLYISDFGELSIVPNRFQPSNAGLVLEPSRIKRRILRPYKLTELAKTGDADKYLLTCEEGLQVDNEAALGIVADLTTS